MTKAITKLNSSHNALKFATNFNDFFWWYTLRFEANDMYLFKS
jgi:hypothetical protein